MPSLLVLAFLLVCSLCCHAVPAPTEISTSTFSRLVTGRNHVSRVHIPFGVFLRAPFSWKHAYCPLGAGAVTWNASSLGVYPVFSTPPFSGFTSVAPLTLAFNFSQAQKALMTTNPNAVLLGGSAPLLLNVAPLPHKLISDHSSHHFIVHAERLAFIPSLAPVLDKKRHDGSRLGSVRSCCIPALFHILY